MQPPSSGSNGPSRFPKLKECAHFHYDVVDLGAIQLSIDEEHHDFHDTSFTQGTSTPRSTDSGGPVSSGSTPQMRERSWRPLSDSSVSSTGRFYIRVSSRDRAWVVRQSLEGFCHLDRQLHRCIYDRKYSLLPEIELNDISGKSTQEQRKFLSIYLKRFSSIACNMINCGPILTWMEMDNRGNHLVATDNGTINVPALAAGHVVKRYVAQSLDELTLEVGNIVSIIDMPPAKESTWWQGKCKFEVGFFPSECVQVISGIVPESMATKLPPKPVLRKRGKLISFLRSFFTSRPTRAQLKQTGIVKERVFGCDLGEHLLNSGHEVPLVLQVCASAIESHGIVDGIYRLSGVASNIQKLRNTFDEDRVPELTEDLFVQDVHCISSLLKMYFRELPNPLFTYLLYDKFALAMEDEDQRLTNIYDVVQQLPPPHYRTASYLMRHLCRVASHSSKTNMHCKNLAIVWAPNLFRSKELEQIQCSTAALSGVGIQAIITEYLIMYADVIFTEGVGNSGVSTMRHRPKSLMPLPSKLLSLEEAQERALLKSPRQKYIDVGGGPTALPHDYHTVVDLPKGKKPRKERKASLSNLKAIFSRSRSGSYRSSGSDRGSLNDPQFQVQSYPPVKTRNSVGTIADAAERRRRLRMAKSVDTLFYGGVLRGNAAVGQFIQDGGHTIVNPYAEDHWSYVTQGSCGAQGGRPRTKSCNSSLSDSSDLDERCTTFIKPLQSSPQNSLKRRARHSDTPSGIKTPSFFSQRQLDHFGRSPHGGKENCDVYRSIAPHGATSQPKISLASRFNIPPEVPKRSTSLYIDSFEKSAPPSRPDSFLIVSKSLATVDSCRNSAPMTLPVPPPRSYSPRYSSSPSQSDHSDEVFNCGSAPTESEHPLTPICELLNASGRTWDATSYDTPAKFSLWMDSLYQERSSGRLEPRSASCRSSIGDASFTAPTQSSGFEASDRGKESEDLATGNLLQQDDLNERWEVPTLVSGSAFVTDVTEFLEWRSSIPDDTYVSSEALRAQLNMLQFEFPTSGVSGGSFGADVCCSTSRPDSFVVDETMRAAGSPLCLMDCNVGSENDVTPTEERLRNMDDSDTVSPEKEHFPMEGERDVECLQRVEMAEEHYKADGGWSDYFSGEVKDTICFDGHGEGIKEPGKGVDGDKNAEKQLQSDHMVRLGCESGLMECLEGLIQSAELLVGGQCVDPNDPVTHEPMDSGTRCTETGYTSSPQNSHDKKYSGLYSRSISDPSEMEKRTSPRDDSVSKSRTKSSAEPHSTESFDSDDHIGDEESWSAGFDVVGLPLFPENDSFVEQIRRLQAASTLDYDHSTFDSDRIGDAIDTDSVTVREHCRSTEVEETIPSHDTSLEFSKNSCFFQELEGIGDELVGMLPVVSSCEATTAFQVVATSTAATTGKGSSVGDKEDDQKRSWVCVAMTGIPNPDRSDSGAMPDTAAPENDSAVLPAHCSTLPDLFSRHVTRDNTSTDRSRRDIEVDDAMSWKASLSLASCLRQLCADGYVADRSNSCSPVLNDTSTLSQTLQNETPYDDLIDSSSRSETGSGVCDALTETVSYDRISVSEPFVSDRVSSEYDGVLLGEGAAQDGSGKKETASEKTDFPLDADWLGCGHRILCSSESDVFSSSVEGAPRFGSPVRRKSVRELKNRFESTADEGVPVKVAAKKRPPVAKKPSIVRSAVMSKSLPRCDSSTLAQDTRSDMGTVSGPESAPDSVSWYQGFSGVLTKQSAIDTSLLMEGYSSYPGEGTMRRSFEVSRPSSAGSTASCESYSSESQVLGGCAPSAPHRKPRCHSLHASSVSEVLSLSFAANSNNGNADKELPPPVGYLNESLSRPNTASSCLESSERSSCAQVVEQFDTKGGERYFAAIAYCNPESLASGTDLHPKEINSNPNSSGSEDKKKSASGSGDSTTSRKAPIPARRNPRRSERRVGDECQASGGSTLVTAGDHSFSVNDKNISSCELLRMDLPREDALTSGAHAESAAPLRPARPPRASPDPPPREPSVGRVRGLSQMFEQQSIDRADGGAPQGRKEQQPQRPHLVTQDISVRNSQEWRARSSSSNGDGEMTSNPTAALRNLTIKL